jgi:hypothetical protein
LQGMGLFRRLKAAGKLPAQVRAAGGLLWKAGPNGEMRFALVHRPAYDDWSLPKANSSPMRKSSVRPSGRWRRRPVSAVRPGMRSE